MAGNNLPAANVAVRRATESDAHDLTNIAFAAKRHWQYPEEWIKLWSDELTVQPGYIAETCVLAATIEARIVGWCAVLEKQDDCWLDFCWVLPDVAGQGIGRSLVRQALGRAAQLGCRTLKVIADPNAEGFYHRQGFTTVGDCPSSPKGRRLPILEADVTIAAA